MEASGLTKKLENLFKKTTKGEFCCKTMHYNIKLFELKLLDVYKHPLISIWYQKVYRRYGILTYYSSWNDIGISCLAYCPFCGTKLPKELEDEDMEIILRKEYEWTDDDCWGHPRRDLPEEFKTDEWWKRRGL